MFDFEKLCRDFHIVSATYGNKHCRPGWIQVHCPFCPGSQDFHLGFSTAANIFTCYRCGRGGKGKNKVVARLLNIPIKDAIEVVERYTSGDSARAPRVRRRPRGLRRKARTKLPAGNGPLSDRHKRYLKGRGFVPEEIEAIWGLTGTGPVGDYKHRVIAPIYLDGELVSYQGRDITGKSDLKYKACPQAEEGVDHQSLLYGEWLVKGKNAVVAVEGIADVWRLGPGAVATFGTAFTTAQVNRLAKYKSVFIMYDADDPNAIKQADKLAARLSARGVSVEVILIDQGDPGELSQAEADAIMTELIG